MSNKKSKVQDLKPKNKNYFKKKLEEVNLNDYVLIKGKRASQKEGFFELVIKVTPKSDFSVVNKELTKIGKEFLRAINCEDIEFRLDISYINLEENEKVNQRLKKMRERNTKSEKEIKKFDKKMQVKKKNHIIKGREIKGDVINIDDINRPRKAIIKAKLFDLDIIETRNGSFLAIMYFTDKSDSITAKFFADEKREIKVKKGNWYKVQGEVSFDQYEDNDLSMWANNIEKAKAPKPREDKADKKRVELHLHSKMSAMDSVLDIEECINLAENWGHKAIALTDHGVVQNFPTAFNTAKNKDIKMIYGCEGYLVDDGEPILYNSKDKKINEETFVVFDLETTGFSPINDDIIEIGAVKVKNGEIIDEFQSLVYTDKVLSREIEELTNITNHMVKKAEKIDIVFDKFLDFVGDNTLVAHNLKFDLSFINNFLEKSQDRRFENTAIDTLNLSRALVDELKKYKLNKLADYFDIALESHHRALDDSKATAEIFLELSKRIKKEGIYLLDEINKLKEKIDFSKKYPYHISILAKNQKGLKNLYKLVSKAHTKTFYKKPRILKSDLIKHREGLLLGSACEAGELFKAIVNNEDKKEIEKIADFYDYLEIQPVANNEFLLEKLNMKSRKQLENINKKIYKLGKKLDKLVVATGDVHFLNPEDKLYREIIQSGQGFDDANKQPPLHLKTTDEMLKDFDYFDEEVKKEVVIENTQKIADIIEDITIIPDELYTPEIEGANEKIREKVYNKAKKLYGQDLHPKVEKRIEKELKSIIGNGFAVIYLISQKLVKKSLEDGYLVGSRGSVGSSLVAFMLDITEVNPLPSHYRCNCGYVEFDNGEIGIDSEDKNCPKCDNELIKDGFDIPFEVFLGFEGDKVPDIDLNFSGEYQETVHGYTKEIFGEENVFRAGTISTLANKLAYGFVKGWENDNEHNFKRAEINRLTINCTGIKKTTGQHPGGQIIVPKNKEIYDFTPIQHPANKKESGVYTTHFDFHAIHDNLLKLDILGHDDPTSLKRLEELTDVNPLEISLDDKDTMKLFKSCEVIDVDLSKINVKLGTLGVPEFNTEFTRDMLRDTRPENFADLIRISGLSHGSNVWLGNAQDIIQEGKADISEVISVRDDIMNFLIKKGMKPALAFKIMEKVRKGIDLEDSEIEEMKKLDLPDWYIDSCEKISYMFPKAHATAYVIMAFRIAWYKINYPLEFYATYFSRKSEHFEIETVLKGESFVAKRVNELSEDEDKSAKDKQIMKVLKVAYEALKRGIEFSSVDIYKSKVKDFIIEDGKLLPPITTIEHVGESAAQSLKVARENREEKFEAISQISNETSINKTGIECMKRIGSLDDLPDEMQMNIFEI